MLDTANTSIFQKWKDGNGEVSTFHYYIVQARSFVEGMSSDRNLYKDITTPSLYQSPPSLFCQPKEIENALVMNIDKSIQNIGVLLNQLGGLVVELNSPNYHIDGRKKQYYDHFYRSLSGAFKSCEGTYPLTNPILSYQKSYCKSVCVGSMRSDSISSYSSTQSTLYNEESERAENDIFWSLVYESFPEWKEKRTTIKNAQLFHHFLEKKNYDSQHKFRGKTNDIEFKERMEVFLAKCMRKLKRRCCDLLRYERVNSQKQELVDKQETNACGILSLMGNIAQQNLTQIQSKNISE